MADPERVRVAPGIEFPMAELTWRFSASGGPGGQHVNTTNSRAEVIFDISSSPSLSPEIRDRLAARLGPVVRVVASDRRSQLRNRELAIQRLVERLREGLVEPTRRRPTRPTLASKRRRLETKRRLGERKRDRRSGFDDS